MQDIYNLDLSYVNRLMGIDPILTPDWQETLNEIMPKLDDESQTVVKSTILSPKGIIYNQTSKQYFAKKPSSLSDTLKSLPLHNKQLVKAAEILQEVYQEAPSNRLMMPCCLLMNWKLL